MLGLDLGFAWKIGNVIQPAFHLILSDMLAQLLPNNIGIFAYMSYM